MAFTPSAPVASRRVSLQKHVCTTRTPSAARPCRAAPPPQMVFGKTVKQTLESAANFSGFVKLAAAAGVDLDVSNATVFAPPNIALGRLRTSLLDELFADASAARAVVLRHILPGRVVTSKQIRGVGFWEGVYGGPLGYEGLGPIVKIDGVRVINPVDNECDNGTIHAIAGLLASPAYKPKGIAQYAPTTVDTSATSIIERYGALGANLPGVVSRRALGATKVSTVGGRKAMGLMKQLPFWMYGPPFNAAKQEDFEPISIAQPDVSSVNYELMPPGTVIVTPDEVSAAKLLPVSGMSKYIGKTKRLVGGDALSDYSRLDN